MRIGRRGTARAWTGALTAGALVVSLVTLAPLGAGCSDQDEEPVKVARAFAEAMRRGDVEALVPLLERPAVERLELAAERASDQVGGRRSVEPTEVLQVVGVDRTIATAKAELIESDDKRARARLTGTDGETHVLELVYEGPADTEDGDDAVTGAWKVRVPLPGEAAVSDAPSDAPEDERDDGSG